MNLMFVWQRGVESLRQPDRQPRCYELTDQEKQEKIMLQNRNVWNTHQLTQQDKPCKKL